MVSSKKKVIFLLEAEAVKLSKVLSKDFLEIEVYAISEGKNRNDYIFLYDSMKKSLPTFSEKPILAFFNPLTKGIEEHNSSIDIDSDTGEEFFDYTGPNAERSVGFVTPNSAKIVDYDGKQWIKLRAKLWVKYNRQLVKNLLKAKTRKVSVEIEILDSYTDEEGAEVIKDFVLDGITILQYRPNTTIPIQEGIAGAKLNLKDFADSADFKTFKKKMSFAYAQQSLEGNEDEKELTCTEKKRIEIDNSKEAAVMEGDWEKPDASFYDWLREASNFKTVSKENALVLEEGWETNASANKYPHHSRKGDKLVVNKRGVMAAYSRGMQQKLFDENPSARRHITKHFKELGLDTKDMFTEDVFKSQSFAAETDKEVDKVLDNNNVNPLEYKNEEKEGNSKMFNDKKMSLIRKFLEEAYPCEEGAECCCRVWVCDISDEEAVYYLDGQHYRAPYKIEETEEEIKVFVDVEKAIKVESAWLDADKKIVFEEEEYTVEELVEKFSAMSVEYATKDEQFKDMEAKFATMEAERGELATSKEELEGKFAAMSQEYEELSASCEEMKAKIAEFEADAEKREIEEYKCEACKMIDLEDLLDSEEDLEAKEGLKALVAQYCDEKKFNTKEELCNFVSQELKSLVYAKMKGEKAKETESGKEEFSAELNREMQKIETPKDCFGVLEEYNKR